MSLPQKLKALRELKDQTARILQDVGPQMKQYVG